MSAITICTMNVENLFGRYKVFNFKPGDQYKKSVLTSEELEEGGGFLPGGIAPKGSFDIYNKDEWRAVTAKALKGKTPNYPDIACLQEIESIRVLRKFNENFLKDVYPYILLIDSHDPRLIDIGVVSKHPIFDVKTHMDEPYNDKSGYLFSRDCLEVTFDIQGTPLTVFVNHLKSKNATGKTAKEKADAKRKAQAARVAEILQQRFPGSDFNDSAFVVVGDFNDTPESDCVKPLVQDSGLENVITRIHDPKERWTYCWQTKKLVSQIDYILLSPRLANDSVGYPYIERKGINAAIQSGYCANPDGTKGEKVDLSFERFPEVKKNKKIDASDHCPVFFELNI